MRPGAHTARVSIAQKTESMTHATAFAPSELSDAKESKAPAPSADRPNSMRTVFILVGAAIVVFMAFTAYSVRKEIQGSAQLAAIKDLYFPLLQRLDANVVRLDKVEATYIETAVTGDRDLIAKAADVGNEADTAYVEIEALDPSLAPKVTALRADLKKYQELATKASLAFLSSDGSDMSSMADMNAALARARADLNAFRQASYEDFVRTLNGSQKDAHVRLIMGLALGVMNLCFMAVLVYFIRNNMKMMTVIATQNRTLEHRVAERTAELSQKTADINAMLHNMKLGVAAVVPGNRIHPEYSRYLQTIFSIDDVGGKDLLETLFRDSTLGVDVKDQISVALGSMLGEDAMMFDLNGHLLPAETQLAAADGSHKVVRMDWSPIVNSHTGAIDKVLLITEDVTHLRELELSSAQQKDELAIISRIIRISASRFNDFIGSATDFIAANRKLISGSSGREQCDVAALFRNMHTIKGNARTFEFTHITDAAHRAEQSYDTLRKDPAAAWNPADLLAELDAVEAAIAIYNKVNEDKLGRKGRAADLLTTRGAFVANEQLAEIRSMAAALVSRQRDPQTEQLQRSIDGLGLVSLSRLISGSMDSLSSLASELKKPVPSVDLRNGEIAFNNQFAEALKSSFMHIVRNSLDHGIEAPADRLRANKPEQGLLRVACERNDDQVELRVSDDGRGLALHKLYEKGIANGIFSATAKPACQEVADLVFNAGLSTATQVTQVSGRGVGMDAVRVFLKEHGATVRIVLKNAAQELGFAPFEFVISVPPTAYRHAA
jgi:HPt (histidine-containing phosphotransfer) domain-containing protein